MYVYILIITNLTFDLRLIGQREIIMPEDMNAQLLDYHEIRILTKIKRLLLYLESNSSGSSSPVNLRKIKDD